MIKFLAAMSIAALVGFVVGKGTVSPTMVEADVEAIGFAYGCGFWAAQVDLAERLGSGHVEPSPRCALAHERARKAGVAP